MLSMKEERTLVPIRVVDRVSGLVEKSIFNPVPGDNPRPIDKIAIHRLVVPATLLAVTTENATANPDAYPPPRVQKMVPYGQSHGLRPNWTIIV